RETTHQLDCTLQCNPSFSKFHENKKPRAPGSGLSRLDFCYLVRSSVPASVKCVIVSAQETLAVRFFILILASVCLPVAVISVLIGVMLFRPVVFSLTKVLRAGAQSIAMTHRLVRQGI